jgi:hypothetical protein
MTWLIQVHGFIVDARDIPKELQIPAWRKGLIPYVPGTANSVPASAARAARSTAQRWW